MQLSSQSVPRLALGLVFASFIVLFQELTLIRWMASQVRVLAYFPNLVLLSSFLGLGMGCLLAGRRNLIWTWPLTVLVVAVATALMGRVVFTEQAASDHLWLLYYDLGDAAPTVPSIKLPILLSFVLGALSFVALGQLIAESIQLLRERWSALWGYSFDILGSLAGVVVFSVLGFTHAFPVHWFALVLAAGAWFFLGSARRIVLYAILAAGVLVVVGASERSTAYSPYYALTLEPDPATGAIEVLANGSLHQIGLDMTRSGKPRPEYDRIAVEGYHVPYSLLGKPPGTVLVLGAGTGNDVATLLDEGAERIDVVEIDPVILRWGREHHPNRPYDSPRVRLFNTDARSFLDRTRGRYDLIVFGTLDSMTRLSALSNVRLDNFVYTQEAIEAARGRLADDGGMALYFMVGEDYISDRFMAMLTEAFGQVPLVYPRNHNLFNTVFLAGPALDGAARAMGLDVEAETRRFRVQHLPGVRIPQDDWPFLYLRQRGISRFYVVILAAIAVLAVAGVAVVSPDLRASLARGRGIDAQMFLFGMSFLLLETRAVTAMNLVWGATWITSAVVFGAILSMVLLATVAMQLRPLPFRPCAVGLMTALAGVYCVPSQALLGHETSLRLFLSGLVVGAPIFFASACFACLFRERAAADRAFGWNLLGAVAGGLLEFASMWSGLRALLLVAAAGYLLAWLMRELRPMRMGTAC